MISALKNSGLISVLQDIYEDYCVLECGAVYSGMFAVVSEECAAFTFRVQEQATQVSAGLSTLKKETVRSYETCLNFYPSTRRHIPEYSTLHNHSR
jgi:hypothetical protein